MLINIQVPQSAPLPTCTGWSIHHPAPTCPRPLAAAASGERRLLSVNLMFDAGRSINPAVDLGQVLISLTLWSRERGSSVQQKLTCPSQISAPGNRYQAMRLQAPAVACT